MTPYSTQDSQAASFAWKYDRCSFHCRPLISSCTDLKVPLTFFRSFICTVFRIIIARLDGLEEGESFFHTKGIASVPPTVCVPFLGSSKWCVERENVPILVPVSFRKYPAVLKVNNNSWWMASDRKKLACEQGSRPFEVRLFQGQAKFQPWSGFKPWKRTAFHSILGKRQDDHAGRWTKNTS